MTLFAEGNWDDSLNLISKIEEKNIYENKY